MAPKLSQSNRGVFFRVNFIAWKSERININSNVAVASAQYLASLDDLVLALYFLELHEIGFVSNKIRYTEVEFLLSKLPTQSASVKHVSVGLMFFRMVMPLKIMFFKYRSNLLMAVQ